jgi:DNA polymerase III delta subunit
VAKAEFSEKALPGFDEAPPVILVTGDVEFFVEEAAGKAREILSGEGTETLRFEDDAPAEAVSDALLNRSLFSPRRIVEFDASRLLGSETPGRLLTKAVEAWARGGPAGRREAFRHVRALLSALDLPSGDTVEETAEAVARRVRRKEDATLLAEILKELPEEKSGGAAILKAALRVLLERGNDGTIALVTAASPPRGVDLLQEIGRSGLVLETSIGSQPEPALRRLAQALAREREVVADPGAIEQLLKRTDARPAAFASELEKLLEWAGKGGRLRTADVDANVEDEASEDVYGLFEAIGRRDAGDALGRLERLFSGREVHAGGRTVGQAEENIWPVLFFGMLASEVRRMLLIRARLEETGPGGFEAGMSFGTFQARVLPRLVAPAAPTGRSPFDGAQGGAHPYALYRAAQRSARYTTRELARALARAADVDVRLKSSAPSLEQLSVYVGQWIAGS